eukprot:m.138630 g.138630  ORF g.138630 m.138630 type:complete len:179 (+) comp15919_c0_seq1:133-669(+)
MDTHLYVCITVTWAWVYFWRIFGVHVAHQLVCRSPEPPEQYVRHQPKQESVMASPKTESKSPLTSRPASRPSSARAKDRPENISAEEAYLRIMRKYKQRPSGTATSRKGDRRQRPVSAAHQMSSPQHYSKEEGRPTDPVDPRTLAPHPPVERKPQKDTSVRTEANLLTSKFASRYLHK